MKSKHSKCGNGKDLPLRPVLEIQGGSWRWNQRIYPFFCSFDSIECKLRPRNLADAKKVLILEKLWDSTTTLILERIVHRFSSRVGMGIEASVIPIYRELDLKFWKISLDESRLIELTAKHADYNSLIATTVLDAFDLRSCGSCSRNNLCGLDVRYINCHIRTKSRITQQNN